MSSNEFNHLINDYDNDEIYNSDYEDNNINNTFQDSLTYSPINSIRDPYVGAINVRHHHRHSDHDQHRHTTDTSNMVFEESSILYPYLVIDGDVNDEDPTVVIIGEENTRANMSHISHTEHHHGDDDGGDQLNLYMTTERDYSNDYDDEFEDYLHTNDPDAEVKYDDDSDHNQILQNYTNHFRHYNDHNHNDDEVKHNDSVIAIPDLQQRHHDSHQDLSVDVNHDFTQSVPVSAAVAVAVKREHLDSTNLQSDTSYEYDTDDFESSVQLTFDTSRDGDDDGDNNEDGEATANDDDKAKDTTKAADEFQFVDNVDDVDWNHFANGFAELYTGLYMDKKDNDSINDNCNVSDGTDCKQQIHAENAPVTGSLSNNQSFEYNDSFEVDDNDDDDNDKVKCSSIHVIADMNRDTDTP